MADNTTLNPGSGGTVIASDDIGGVQHQRVKIQHGSDGSATDTSAASPLPTIREGLLISQGLVTGYAPVNKFGRNGDIDTGSTPEDVWEEGGLMDWPTSAAVVTISSDSSDDDGAPTTNTGAHSVTVEGLDGSFDEISETVTLNGTSSVSTVATFLRVNRAYVATTGTYHGNNAGTITGTISGNTAFNIAPGKGQTQLARYTVPAGKTAYLESIDISVDSTKTANVELFQVPNADDFSQPYSGAQRLVRRFDGVAGQIALFLNLPLAFPEKTDLWFQVESVSANGTSVEVNFDLVTIDD